MVSIECRCILSCSCARLTVSVVHPLKHMHKATSANVVFLIILSNINMVAGRIAMCAPIIDGLWAGRCNLPEPDMIEVLI